MKLSKQTISEAVRLVSLGLNDKDVADYIGVAPQTFSTWRNHPKNSLQHELSEALKKADSQRKAALLSRIIGASDTSWQAAAWLLERRYPEEYAKPKRPEEDTTVEVISAVKGLTEAMRSNAGLG